VGIDDGRKDGATFENFVFKKRASVGGHRMQRGSGSHTQKGKELTEIDAQKLDIMSNAV
jgi:hypothetical protein